MILTLIGTFSFAQVIFQIQAPSTPVGLQNTTYPITVAEGTDWSTPDLLVSANSITAALEFVDDGGSPALDVNGNPGNQDACTGTLPAIFVQPSLVGKIAVLYRGECQFGHKARAAELAGAIGCIIINHTGAAVGMAGGDSGLVVTIPLIMISEQAGNLLKADIAAGTITQAFIGTKSGLFANDLGIGKGEVLRARRFSNLAPLSQNASEFSVPVGAIVRNIGNQAQSSFELKCTIDNGTLIYSESAVVAGPLASGDSIFVPLTTFSQATYPVGNYTMTYTLTTNPTADGEPSDNVVDASFMISDSLYSYGRLDPTTFVPLNPAGFRSNNFSTDWEGCFAFQDPNASRLESVGMTVISTTSSTEDLIGKFVEVRVYQWNNVFTDLDDPNFALDNLAQIDVAFHVYASDLQGVPVFVQHTSPVRFTDNQRYLFCLNSSEELIFAGYDNDIDYTLTQDDFMGGAFGAHLQPSTPGSSDGTYFLNGFGQDVQLAASVQFRATTVGVDEVSNENGIYSYPNPVADILNIPVGKRSGTAVIQLFDIAGKLVIAKDVSFTNNETLKLDVSTLVNGSYIANMIFEDKSTVKFNVVVSK